MDAVGLILWLVLVVGVGAITLILARICSRTPALEARPQPYECGLDPATPPRGRPLIAFFLIAALFVIFDAEIVCLVPFAVAFREILESGNGILLLIEVGIFLALIALALLFAWGRGALEWER